MTSMLNWSSPLLVHHYSTLERLSLDAYNTGLPCCIKEELGLSAFASPSSKPTGQPMRVTSLIHLQKFPIFFIFKHLFLTVFE